MRNRFKTSCVASSDPRINKAHKAMLRRKHEENMASPVFIEIGKREFTVDTYKKFEIDLLAQIAEFRSKRGRI